MSIINYPIRYSLRKWESNGKLAMIICLKHTHDPKKKWEKALEVNTGCQHKKNKIWKLKKQNLRKKHFEEEN